MFDKSKQISYIVFVITQISFNMLSFGMFSLEKLNSETPLGIETSFNTWTADKAN